MTAITGEENIYFITWVTHSSRISERMITYAPNSIKQKPLELTRDEEVIIAKFLIQIIEEDNFIIPVLNVCRDHVHLLLKCDEKERDNIIRKLKGKTTQLYKKEKSIKYEFHLWAQKYNHKTIISDEQLEAAYDYVRENRIKHNLTVNEVLDNIINDFAEKQSNTF